MNFLFSFLFFFLFLLISFFRLFFLSYSSIFFELLSPLSYFETPLSFCFDYVSFFFFSSVSLISIVVFLYSHFYMDRGRFFNNLDSRFFFLLFLFVISMMFLVFSGSWVMVILGWDGLGLISFVLVVYYNNSSSLDSGLLTVFTNRVGDCLFIISFMFMFYTGWVTIEFLSFSVCIFFCVVLFLGCVTKRAQLPFSSWLPAAMAAPTPVSSLVHSSTLVTAGVFLLIRFNFLLFLVLPFLKFLSLFTVFVSGACAVFELDFKKVVAMSTLRQLGFIVFSISCGYWLLGFLHIIFHAFFKSSLFLSTGNLMHYLFGSQDSRGFGSLGASFFSKVIFFSSCLRLMGFPFSLGFYSKDSILGDMVFYSFSLGGGFFLISCCFTVAYRLRLIYMAFLNYPSFRSSVGWQDYKLFYLPLFFLFSFSVFLGNFFLFYFLPPVDFSFLDLFFGIFIVFFGFLLFLFFPRFYFFNFILSSISFLTFFSSTFLSSLFSKFSYEGEYTWGELSRGALFLGGLIQLSAYARRLYKLHFASFLIFLMLFFVVVV